MNIQLEFAFSFIIGEYERNMISKVRILVLWHCFRPIIVEISFHSQSGRESKTKISCLDPITEPQISVNYMMCNSQNTIIVGMLNVFCLYVCGSEICLKLKLDVIGLLSSVIGSGTTLNTLHN